MRNFGLEIHLNVQPYYNENQVAPMFSDENEFELQKSKPSFPGTYSFQRDFFVY